MGASLIQPASWVKQDEGLRVVNQPTAGPSGLDPSALTSAGMLIRPKKYAPTNFVPAVAVRRRGRVFRAMTGRKGRVGGGASGPPVAPVLLGAPAGALRPPGQRLSRRKTAAVGVTTAPRRPPGAAANLFGGLAAAAAGAGAEGLCRSLRHPCPGGGGPLPVQLESSPGWPQFPTEG